MVCVHPDPASQGPERSIRGAPGCGRAQGVAHTADAAQTRRVLVVDDNEDACISLAGLLRTFGHEVVVANDGPESLSLVDAGQTFDVALLDIGLPGMNGHQLAQLLRQRVGGSAMRLVALTGYGRPPDTAGSQRTCFDDYFVKPVDVRGLLASISKARPRPS